MSALATLAELRKMPVADLLKEIKEFELSVAKDRLNVRMLKEKDTAKYCREKKHLARMKTILTEKRQEKLNEQAKTTTVTTPASSAAAEKSKVSAEPKKKSPSKS